MNKVKVIAMGIVFALATLAFVGCASATIIYVPDDYAKIQWAVDSASPRDTIIIRDGTYTENVNVRKSLTIRSENGSDFTIIQPANPDYHIFEVAMDYVSINGFTVKGAPGWTGLPCAGIYLINANYCNISNNNASFNNEDGIYLSNSFYNNVTNNIVSDNRCGIFLNYCYNNYITNNNASSNLWMGIWLYESPNNTMANNIVSNNDHGILLVRSYNNDITNNIVSFNKRHGIYIHASYNNSIISNNVWNNNAGIQLDAYSHSNNITKNNALNNDYGIYLYKSSNSNLYLNNFINNTDNVYSLGSTNIWNSTERITYTYNSSIYTNYLGNYWDDYTGSDADGDGIGDTPYSIDSNQDYYPLIMTAAVPDITAPVITNITNTTPTNDSVTITWDTDEDSDSLVRYGTVSGTYTSDKSDAVMVISHSITLIGLNPDTTYYFTVNSTDTSGNSNESVEYSFITAIPDTTAPSSVTNLHSTIGTTHINFTWTNPSDPDFNHTELYLNGTVLTNIPAPQNYYNITGLLPDTSYELSTRTVDTSGNINLTWVNDTASTLPASGTTLNLYTGWNLISLPLMPEDTSITSLMSPINGNYSIVWAYNASDTVDHWKKYDPGAPFGNDLTTMEAGKGYWIMMISDDTLLISGTVPESTDINLTTGWNLIGYNSLDNQPIAEALSSISGNYTIGWAYDASDTADHWKKYDPLAPFGNDLEIMEPGKGYWIMMSANDYLRYSFSPKYEVM